MELPRYTQQAAFAKAASKYDLICSQESLLHPNDNFYLKDFHTVRKNIEGLGMRGICLLVKDNISFSSVDL